MWPYIPLWRVFRGELGRSLLPVLIDYSTWCVLVCEHVPQGDSQTFNSKISPKKVNQVSYFDLEIDVEVTVLHVVWKFPEYVSFNKKDWGYEGRHFLEHHCVSRAVILLLFIGSQNFIKQQRILLSRYNRGLLPNCYLWLIWKSMNRDVGYAA